MENIEFTYTEQADGEWIQQPGTYQGTVKSAKLEDTGPGKHRLNVTLETEDGRLFMDRILITEGKSWGLSKLIKAAQIGDVADGQKVGFNAKMIQGIQVGFKLANKPNKDNTKTFLNVVAYYKPEVVTESNGIEL